MPRVLRALTACAALALVSPVHGASARPVTAARGMVVAPEHEAAAVGLEVLRRGGNAIDASVATAFALAVTYPRAGNLGGGGFLLYRLPDGTHAALDFRETAPAKLTADKFKDTSGKVDPKKSQEGGLAVGVPGSVAGLIEAHRRWGTRPLAELIGPAIHLAEDGVVISERTAEVLKQETSRLAADRAARAIFTHDGLPMRAGERLVQADLAGTLRAIAKDGADAFYSGRIAEAIAKGDVAAGGVMTVKDLSSYRAKLRTPLVGRYRGRTVVAFPPPSSGGIVLLQALAQLERFDLAASGPSSSLTLHRIVESLRRAFADRSAYIGDPDTVTVPVKGLLDPAYLTRRQSTIRDDRATPSREIGPGKPTGSEGLQTLHFSIADAHGGAVALTTTLNSWYGAAIVAPGTGVVLNNEIDDFSLSAGVANQFGLLGGRANAVAPGKRPLSSMCPAIVESADRGARPLLILGSPGGPRIISAVLQTILHVIDDGMNVQEAVDAPRIHHQWMPDTLVLERGLPKDVTTGLESRGHTLETVAAIGNVCAIGLDADGRWTGAADPRDEGVAVGY